MDLHLYSLEEWFSEFMLELERWKFRSELLKSEKIQEMFLEQTVRGILRWLQEIDTRAPLFLLDKSKNKPLVRLGSQCNFEYDCKDKSSVVYNIKRDLSYHLCRLEKPSKWVGKVVHIPNSLEGFPDIGYAERLFIGPKHFKDSNFIYYLFAGLHEQLEAIARWFEDNCFALRLYDGRNIWFPVSSNKYELLKITSRRKSDPTAVEAALSNCNRELIPRNNIRTYYPPNVQY